MYQQMIREEMAAMGFVGAMDPRHVEAYMRVEYGTLDHLSHADFRREIGIALGCQREAGPEHGEMVARSVGL